MTTRLTDIKLGYKLNCDHFGKWSYWWHLESGIMGTGHFGNFLEVVGLVIVQLIVISRNVDSRDPTLTQ